MSSSFIIDIFVKFYNSLGILTLEQPHFDI